ncbi:MAG: hypothetical protein KAU22_07960, partial [Desulfuromonadales bacterium]|nr:hypothetical protein [Desulfuromonadales bacterium]
MRKIFLSSLLVLVCAVSGFALPQTQPQAQVKEMVDSILGVLQQSDLSAEEKKEQVSGRVQEYLNIESMARRTLGAN